MASFADFDIYNTFGRFLPFTAPDYDKETHQYSHDYVNPRSWTVTLDARRGLMASLPTPVAVATSVDEFLDQDIKDPQPVGPEGGGGPGVSLPKTFVAYTWTIIEEEGPFRLRESVARPINPTWIKVVELPREGWYTVTCHVSFTDRLPEEKTVRYLLRDFLIASIGDSLAAGQGNPDERGRPVTLPTPEGFDSQCDGTTLSAALSDGIDFGVLGSPSLDIQMEDDPVWQEPEAERSMQSGHALAARALQTNTWRDDDTLVNDLITFVSFARSGAGIFDGLLDPQGDDDDFIGVGQTEEMRRTVGARAVDALLISISGNDAGFSGILTDLVTKDFSPWRIGKDAEGRAAVVSRTEKRLGVGLTPPDRGEVESRFDALGREIEALRQQIPIGAVYITPYPTSLFEIRDGGGEISTKVCGIFSGPDLDITPADAREISRLGGILNDLIRRKAQEFHWHFVDVVDDFRGRGYCAPEKERCWRGAEESCDLQGNFNGTMHPNRRGHAIYGFRLAEILRQKTITPPKFEPVQEPFDGVVDPTLEDTSTTRPPKPGKPPPFGGNVDQTLED